MEHCLAVFVVVACLAISLVGSSHGNRIGAVTSTTNDLSTFNVLDYGAIGDGKRDDTQAFTKAWIEVCNESDNTPTLVVPQGYTFLLNSVSFMGPCKSTDIHVEIQGKIVAPSNIGNWGKCQANTWLYFGNIDNLIVDGEGEIDGKVSIWWNNNAINSEDELSCNRPRALCFMNCNGLQLSGLTHKNSPGSHISMGGCNNSTVSHINIIAPEDSPNTDGIDISSSTNLNILDSIIGTGDDCIAIGTGTSFINITNITCGPGHGISVGSLGNNGEEAKVEEIHVKNCTFSNTMNGARIKTWQGGSGYARSITYDDIILTGVNNPIIIDQYYCIDKECTLQPSAVAVTDVRFSGFEGTSSSVAGITLNCSQAIPCKHIEMEDIAITALNPVEDIISYCQNVGDLQQSSVEPQLDCTQ